MFLKSITYKARRQLSNLSFNQFFNLRGNAKARHPRHICARQAKARAKTRCKVTVSLGGYAPRRLLRHFGPTPALRSSHPAAPQGLRPRPYGLTPSMVHQSALRARPHCHHHCEHHHLRFSTVQIPLSRRGCGFLKGRLAIRKVRYGAWSRQGTLLETEVVRCPAG